MKATSIMLSDVVKVLSRFQRSVNLEKDYWGQGGGSNEYIVTFSAQKALRSILEGLQGEGAYRSITLTGPYGVGKSAFALFLTQLLCGSHLVRDKAMEKLRAADVYLLRLFLECISVDKKAKGFLPILLTARRTPAPFCIMQGLANSLLSVRSKKLRAIGSRLRDQTDKAGIETFLDSRVIADELSGIARTATEVGYAGVLLIVDELGKLFEYGARDLNKGDVYVLQEIAEQAARSGAAPTVMVGLLHQGFDEYAKHLDIATRQEWAKIQGRFTDLAFQEPTEQLIRLIASAISVNDNKFPIALNRYLVRLAKAAVSCSVSPPSMSATEFRDVLCRCYPLHPSTLVALPVLFKRFAQNERSLFSYLTSLEPGGFQDFLRTHGIKSKAPCFVRLPDLFDYFTNNFGPGLYRHPQARRWLEAADALDRKSDLTAAHADLVKTIGVLSVVGEFSHLQATEAAIACSLDDSIEFSANTQKKINDLRECSILTYRRFNDTYRVWEGSDIDIEERMAEGIRKVSRSGFATIMQEYLVTRPMVARRHSFETGALRYFELAYLDDPDDISFYERADKRADGTVVICLAESSVYANEFRKCAEEASDRLDLLLAIPQQIGDLYAAAVELAALRWTWDNTPQLQDDRVARREVALRITEAEQLLTRNISSLLDPRPEPEGSSCLWFWGGKPQAVANRSEVLQLLSRVCDSLYNKAPKVRNELVTRRSLSSAAAGARRNLIEAMLSKAPLPFLGIEGYPPERSMYESVLLSTGIHAEHKPGSWGLDRPNDSEQHNIQPAWDHLYSRIFGGQTDPIGVDCLFAELALPPFGVLDGLHPLLLCAFMLVYPDETTLYREGTFIPEPGIADFEIILRRPELFAIGGSRIEGEKRAVLTRLAAGLNTKPATVAVVRGLFKMVKGLPEFSWKTRRLPEPTLRLRAAFENARSPEQFLFAAIPEALGIDGISGKNPRKKDVNSFFDVLNSNLQTWAGSAPLAVKSAREILLKECGLETDNSGWRELQEQSLKVEASVTDTLLLNFVRRVSQAGSAPDAVETVLALVANRPPGSWSDADVDRFPGAARAIGRSFARAVHEARLTVENPLGINDLPVDQRTDAHALLTHLRKEMAMHSRGISTNTLRAVVVELAKELDKKVRRKVGHD